MRAVIRDGIQLVEFIFAEAFRAESDDAETEAFFQHFGSLFEDDNLQPITDARDIRRRPVERPRQRRRNRHGR